jgi:hypothetical protein
MNTRKGLGVVLILSSLAAAQRARADPEAPPASPDAKVWRVGNKCGVNVIYLMASLLASKPDYEQVERLVPVDEKGTTLAQMREGARRFGLRLEIVKGTPAALLACRFPVIAHWEEEQGATGHYVIVLAANADEVQYIDGTTALIATVSMSDFLRKWTGFLLLPSEGPGWRAALPAIAVLGASLFVCTLLLGRRWPSPLSRRKPAEATPGVTP